MRSPNDIPSGPATRLGSVDENGYTQLAALRSGIGRYLAWVEERAREQTLSALHLEWLAESGPQLAEVWASFGAPPR